MKKADFVLILTSALLVLGLGISVLCLPQRDFSEEENRALTTWQTPTARELLSGTATARLSAFYTDQFPLRSSFTALKAEGERFLGKRENNGILFGKDGYLIPRSEYVDLSAAKENLASFGSLLDATDLPCSLLIAPRSMDVMSSCLPRLYSADPAIFEVLEDSGQPYVLPLDPLRGAAEAGEYVWYKTDHHWTTYGAYLAYAELARSMEITPYPLSYFRQETVSESFLGTSHSKVGMINTQPDSILLFRYEDDHRFLITDRETGKMLQGFYDLDALEEKDAYRVFLGGNSGHVSVTDPTLCDRPRLLLIKDSFACSLAPFLALHFDLELIDPRYHRGSLSSLLESESFDGILVVQGLDTLATDKSLARYLHH